eukprot:TRINITY_DN2074_c0_g1_i1.p1 TRINITY_DN2074_c0_g1~~TRINITY_DN2074_c0_g1_i1.p1  ORF type:complete len:202 (+),score=43.49 TRINITY_DN2074_c0_g1_i1:32-637(+)
MDNLESSKENQEQFLPIANIGRLMKKSLPEHAKISKESKEFVQECASEYVCFITSEASDRCIDEKRKTITSDDVVFSMNALGFLRYVRLLKIFAICLKTGKPSVNVVHQCNEIRTELRSFNDLYISDIAYSSMNLIRVDNQNVVEQTEYLDMIDAGANVDLPNENLSYFPVSQNTNANNFPTVNHSDVHVSNSQYTPYHNL